MNIDHFFLKTIDDIETRLNSEVEYDLIRMAGLIHHLIIGDGVPLLHQVNKNKNVKIRFKVGRSNPHTADGIYVGPEYTEARYIKFTNVNLELDYFIKEPSTFCFALDNGKLKPILVGEFLTCVANLYSDNPKNIRIKEFLNQTIDGSSINKEFGLSMLYGELKKHTKIVLDAVKPLKEAIDPINVNF